MIIDFHTHTFPDKIATQAIAHMQSMRGNATCFNHGTSDDLRESMKTADVTYSVVLPVTTNPDKASHINDYSIAHTGQNGLIYFGGIHPDTSDWKAELDRIYQAGLKGVKLHPPEQHTDINDPRYLRILERCGELGLIVTVHAGMDPGFPDQERCTPKMLRSALDQVGPVTLIAAHMGGILYWEHVPEYLLDTNIYLDTAFSIGNIAQARKDGGTEPGARLMDETAFCRLVTLFGKERVLFGTDSPWNRQIYARKQIEALSLDQETKDHIFYKNACRLLNIK